MASYFIVAILYSVICGAFCRFLAKEKNRDRDTWFWLGFLFGIFALIAIAAVPKSEAQIQDSKLMINNSQWECPKCGKTNSLAMTECPNCYYIRSSTS